MTQPVLDLPKLSEFLHGVLRSTDQVKSLLNSRCDEAKFVLTPWPLETITRRQPDEKSCTCARIMSSEEHVEEIASGIDKAIAQARRLREKLALNVLEEKKLARKLSVRQIYAPVSKENKIVTRSAESKTGKENGVIERAPSKEREMQSVTKQGDRVPRTGEKKFVSSMKRDFNLKKNSHPGDLNIANKKGNSITGRTRNSERDKKSVIETRQTISNAVKMSEANKRIADKKLVVPSPYNCLAAASGTDRKSKAKKNFIAANKSSIKNIKPANSFVSITPRMTMKQTSRKLINNAESSATIKSSDSMISAAISAAELDKLIGKISMESTDNKSLNSDANFETNGCPIHDSTAAKYVEEKIYTTVDVAEGLDRFGIPSDLVKVLKVYHGYLNGKSMIKSTNKRNEKAAHKFLSEFQSMNRIEEKSSKRIELENVCKDFLPVLKESCDKKMDFVELCKLRIRYTDLDSACKSLRIRGVSPTKRKMTNIIENRSDKSFLQETKAWRLNAVWNEASIPSLQSLEGISTARCIRYSNRNQLLELFDLMQRIQQLKYRANLIDLLINEVVPWVQNSLEPTSEDYVNAYKTISIMSNLLHLRVPVLVRTDK